MTAITTRKAGQMGIIGPYIYMHVVIMETDGKIEIISTRGGVERTDATFSREKQITARIAE